jgi:heme/copper-type cytochrome/quinol oxidase subunit 2
MNFIVLYIAGWLVTSVLCTRRFAKGRLQGPDMEDAVGGFCLGIIWPIIAIVAWILFIAKRI